MDVILVPFLDLMYSVLAIFKWIVILSIALNWLMACGMIRTYNAYFAALTNGLFSITESVFSRVRTVVPAVAGVDLSPIVVLLGVHFIQNVIARFIVKFGVL